MSGSTRSAGPAIVVGTDGSASAIEAVKRAATMALARGAALHIVNGYPRGSRVETKMAQAKFQREIGYSQMGSFQVDGIGDNYVIALQALEDTAHEVEHPNLRIYLHAVNAAPHKALRWVAEQKDAQLIVVGNKPAASILHPFRKDLHEELQRTTTCPVHVVDTEPFWHAPRGLPGVGGIAVAGVGA